MLVNTLFGQEEISQTKRCIKCGEIRHISEYGVRAYGKEGDPREIRNDCNPCRKVQSKILKKLKEDYPRPDENHQCPLCLKTEKELRKRISDRKKTFWVLDHCHTTGKFRGYICDYCNTSIARSFEDPETLRRQADYLEYHRYV